MRELIADVSGLKRQIWPCQSQLDTKRVGTKIKELKNPTTFLKAQHGLMIFYLFYLDD
jgi:hypothetical protein